MPRYAGILRKRAHPLSSARGRTRLDPELRDLERAATASPDDSALQVKLARAHERAGDWLRAAEVLARAVELLPGEQDLLVALDKLTRGGVDPRAPWPAERGDGWRTGRSRAVGPTKGAIVSRRPLIVDVAFARDFVVGERGRLWLSGGRYFDVPATDARSALEPSSEPHPRALCVLEIDPKSGAPGSQSGRTPIVVLADGRVVSGLTRAQHDRLEGRVPPEIAFLSPGNAGLGHVVGRRGTQGVEARALSTPGATRWNAAVPRPPARLSFAPGARLVVLTEGGLGARGSLHRFELATGKALPAIALDRVGLHEGIDLANVIASEDGCLYLGLGGSVLALSPEGETLWRWNHLGEPAALAGERSEVLVVCEPRTFQPVTLDRLTGEKLWQSRDACLNGLPKVDDRGVIYWRREQELVWLDTKTGEVAGSALVGEHRWEFAFAGDGKAYAVRAAVRGTPAELVVVE